MRREKRQLNVSKILAKICGILTSHSIQSVGSNGPFFRAMCLVTGGKFSRGFIKDMEISHE